MSESIAGSRADFAGSRTKTADAGSAPAYRAYQILHVGFVTAPILIPNFLDVALRDFGLSLEALALARLSQEFSS